MHPTYTTTTTATAARYTRTINVQETNFGWLGINRFKNKSPLIFEVVHSTSKRMNTPDKSQYFTKNMIALWQSKVKVLIDKGKSSSKWCGWSDSNRHSFRNQILSLARLPVPPHPHLCYKRQTCRLSLCTIWRRIDSSTADFWFFKNFSHFLLCLMEYFFYRIYSNFIYSKLICKVFTT